MPDENHLLSLEWNNHLTSLRKLIGKLYLQEQYADCTILCDDQCYPVHSWVLSSCSEYFDEIISKYYHLNKNPFFVVKDVAPKQMEHLIKYMYLGRIQIPQSDIPGLIKTAEAFKIKGLAIPDFENEEKQEDEPIERTNVSSPEQNLLVPDDLEMTDTVSIFISLYLNGMIFFLLQIDTNINPGPSKSRQKVTEEHAKYLTELENGNISIFLKEETSIEENVETVRTK